MRLYLDRFEGAFAVIEVEEDDGSIRSERVARSAISPEVAEGDALHKKDETYYTDRALTDERRRALIERMNVLKNRGI
ncbi:MAG: DUF3006 domain-containing protein [Bacteroides sp.]|nr:DUF3006 domain-containing protein [Eubacterium sp.]MCM1418274.1 DUF3006 domain-containing protein [Roseburia sp.]MCM1462343.1 DUF3006 domain-containing protein [Bacteroides sp.]